jgi:hypothetical protein
MKKLLAVLLGLVYSLCAWDIAACDTLKTGTDTSTCVVMPFKVQRGVWFELVMAEQLRYRYEIAPLLASEVGTLKEELSLNGRRAALVEEIVKRKDLEIVSYRKSVGELQENEVKLISDSQKWYRQPLKVAAVVTMVDVVLIVAGIVLLKR